MTAKKMERTRPADGALSFTIDQFCARIPMSRSTYEKLKRRGKHPREMRIGTSVRISVESASAWIRERERDAANSPLGRR